jgi:hypothetical protein
MDRAGKPNDISTTSRGMTPVLDLKLVLELELELALGWEEASLGLPASQATEASDVLPSPLLEAPQNSSCLRCPNTSPMTSWSRGPTRGRGDGLPRTAMTALSSDKARCVPSMGLRAGIGTSTTPSRRILPKAESQPEVSSGASGELAGGASGVT